MRSGTSDQDSGVSTALPQYDAAMGSLLISLAAGPFLIQSGDNGVWYFAAVSNQLAAYRF